MGFPHRSDHISAVQIQHILIVVSESTSSIVAVRISDPYGQVERPSTLLSSLDKRTRSLRVPSYVPRLVRFVDLPRVYGARSNVHFAYDSGLISKLVEQCWGCVDMVKGLERVPAMSQTQLSILVSV